ncbi:MAG: hypothetical protein ACRELA_24510, partial [Candidatus Rokuibacteriota bacterium]
MNHIFLDTRDGRLRLYLHGDLQFDARDERLYHEPLGLVPVALAVGRAPARALRVLILGGGDGLALRETLRFAEVREAHVVDRDPDVLRLGVGPLAHLNGGAFRDPRARTHARDARSFLEDARGFDVLIFDLTYPGDLGGATLFSVPFLRKVRAALRPGGVLAVNAVSPELTPQAFGCIGATLGAAGFWAVPYAFCLPSFREEGYGRWGFFFASARPISKAELRHLALPAGAGLTAEAVILGTLFPAHAATAMHAAANQTDELLYHVYNPAPLAWEPPFTPLRFGPVGSGLGPRLTVAQGFARWLRAPDGRRTLEELLHCLPLAHRASSREVLLEWSDQAEVIFREVDLRAFVQRALRRSAELPRAWVRELRGLRDRIRDGLPPMRELLEHAYRVFAIFLLLLLFANLFFPDNLFAKGFSSSSSRSTTSWSSGGSGSAESSFYGFNFTDPSAPSAPYRRFAPSGGWVYGPGVPRARVYDSRGQEYPAQQAAAATPQGGPQPVSALLALSPELQLLESGALVYVAGVPGVQCVLEPGRLLVLDTAGQEVLALRPSDELLDQARRQILAQGPLVEKALADHQRWVGWVRWASVVPDGRQAVAELAELTAIKRAVDSAQRTWRGAAPPVPFDAKSHWVPLFPGVYLDPRGRGPVGLVRGRWVAIAPGSAY